MLKYWFFIIGLLVFAVVFPVNIYLAYQDMIKDSKYTNNKELMIIPGAVHTDLYDNLDVIPFDKIEKFIKDNLK